jgi:hypothetical protein
MSPHQLQQLPLGQLDFHGRKRSSDASQVRVAISPKGPPTTSPSLPSPFSTLKPPLLIIITITIITIIMSNTRHFQVRHDVRELVRITDTLLGYTDEQEPPATYDELYNVFRLSGDIAFNLGKMAAMAQREDRKRPGKASRTKGAVPRLLPDPDEDLLLSQLICHNCDAVSTPKWRTGPDGPCTLCNVCGLVYAKRKRRGDYRA